jgi:hypothetical protein
MRVADCRKLCGTDDPAVTSNGERVILQAMPRSSRRFIAALLWIAVALLPVRGLAAAVMPVLMSGMAPAAASAPVDEMAAAMPCHGASQDAASDADTTSHNCALCDLCHSSVAAAPAAPAAMPVMHDAQPVSAMPRAALPHAPDGLFRPPRTDLA